MPAEPALSTVVTLERGELVFAVVAPAGTDLDQFERVFTDLLRQFGYATNVIRLSGLAERLHTEHLGVELDSSSEFRRIDTLMTVGDRLRARASRGDILALHAISEINSKRAGVPLVGTAHLLRSLKHPDEVEALRRVYGPGFFLLGLNSGHNERFDYLTQRKGMTR